MTLPSIHLNGTSRSALVEQYVNAGTAVADALFCVAQNGPNGRDYYPQGPEAFKAAAKEHAARLERLTAIRDELLNLACKIEEI